MNSLETDKYQILAMLGAGGFGAVYSGRTRPAGVPVAFKTVVGSKEPPRYLDREFRILSGLSHPNIVRVYEKFTLDNKLWFAMEKIDGTSIDQAIPQAGDLRLAGVAASVFRQLQSALDYIHGHHIVHAELSPGNLLVTDCGVLKLVDFEHCRVLHLDESEYWPAGTIVGTPAYMTPEHIIGAPVIESDYFVVGTLLYECLVGSSPFQRASIGKLLHEISTFDPEQILAAVPGVDIELRDILAHLWTKELPARHVGWEMLRAATANTPLVATPTPRSSDMLGVRPRHGSTSEVDALTHDMVLRLYRSAVEVGLHDDRHALLVGLDPSISSVLPVMPEPAAQLLSDLHTLNRTRPLDGSTPLLRWLSAAIALRSVHREVEVFLQCQHVLQQRGSR
jgi:serine/threonine protein kinase